MRGQSRCFPCFSSDGYGIRRRRQRRREVPTRCTEYDPMARILIVSIAIVPCVILLLPAMVLTALLSSFASTVRAIARRLERTYVPWTQLIEFDQHLGWKPRPGLDTYYLATDDDVFRIVTDGEGWPG